MCLLRFHKFGFRHIRSTMQALGSHAAGGPLLWEVCSPQVWQVNQIHRQMPSVSGLFFRAKWLSHHLVIKRDCIPVKLMITELFVWHTKIRLGLLYITVLTLSRGLRSRVSISAQEQGADLQPPCASWTLPGRKGASLPLGAEPSWAWLCLPAATLTGATGASRGCGSFQSSWAFGES